MWRPSARWWARQKQDPRPGRSTDVKASLFSMSNRNRIGREMTDFFRKWTRRMEICMKLARTWEWRVRPNPHVACLTLLVYGNPKNATRPRLLSLHTHSTTLGNSGMVLSLDMVCTKCIRKLATGNDNSVRCVNFFRICQLIRGKKRGLCRTTEKQVNDFWCSYSRQCWRV